MSDSIPAAPLSELATITMGMDDGSVTVVRVGDLGQLILPESLPTRVNLDQANINSFRIAPGDFLLARAIGSEEHLGKASIVRSEKVESHEVRVFDSHVMRLKFDQAAMHPEFFWQWMKTPGGRALFMRNAGRTAVQFNTNATQIARIAIALPPHGIAGAVYSDCS